MDDHHYQPIWPMIQGALDYILNLAGEGWAMVWKSGGDAVERPTREMRERSGEVDTLGKRGSMINSSTQRIAQSEFTQDNGRGG